MLVIADVNRSAARLLCFVLPLALVAVQALGTNHALTERHAVCDEHGELVHGGAHLGSAPARHASVGALPETEHGAHGCALLTGLCQASAHAAAVSVEAPPPVPALEPLDRPGARPHSGAPLDFAPKTSPPGPTTV